MVNEIQECQMLFEHRTEMDKCIVLHQHFYQIIHEKTFLMKFDENQQTELCIEVDENLAPKEIKFTIDK